MKTVNQKGVHSVTRGASSKQSRGLPPSGKKSFNDYVGSGKKSSGGKGKYSNKSY